MSLLQELARQFGVGHTDLAWIIHTAPKRYKVYEIPKRRGGMRTIAQPSGELKDIQRYIVDTKLSKLRVHRSAMGYVVGRNILQNAEAHRRNRVLLKLDFSDFFPSIKVKDWKSYVRRNPLASELFADDLSGYCRILFWGKKTLQPRCLSIGAPSSPILSNILMYDLDTKLYSAARDLKLKYTRYADDLTISGNSAEKILEFEQSARKIIKNTQSPKLRFNEEKRGVFFSGQRKMVTGLVITPENKVSLGRERKRLISAMLHHSSLGRATDDEKMRLKGMLGFAIANEPDFVSRLREKYGSAAMNDALRFDAREAG